MSLGARARSRSAAAGRDHRALRLHAGGGGLRARPRRASRATRSRRARIARPGDPGRVRPGGSGARSRHAGADVLWRETPVTHTIDPRVLPELQSFVAAAPPSREDDRLSRVWPSSTRTSAARSPPTSSGASRTSRGSRCRSRTTGSSSALVTVSDPRGVENLDALDAIYHWTELIQSSPLAVERSVHGAIGGAYRSQGITTLELRFNPMKRNRGGERDLDHIILAAIRGLDRARLEYPQVRAGLILMMDRTFDARQNAIIVEKAIALGRPRRRRRRHRRPAPGRRPLRLHGSRADGRDGARGRARRHDPRRRGGRRRAPRRSREVVEHLRPDRIGHGILAAGDPALMAALREAGIVLEICPTSNLLTKALPDEEAVRDTFRAFVEHGVAFTIATDGPEMMRTHLRDELELLERIGALDERRAARRRTPAATRRASSAAEPTSLAPAPGRWKGCGPDALEKTWLAAGEYGRRSGSSTSCGARPTSRSRSPCGRCRRFSRPGCGSCSPGSCSRRSSPCGAPRFASPGAKRPRPPALGVVAPGLRRRRRHRRRDADRLERRSDDRRLGAAAGDRLAHDRPGARRDRDEAQRVVGLAGLALIIVPSGLSGGSTAVGLAMMLGATISWSTGSFVSGPAPAPA